jgi:hypothetical protein
MFNTIGINEAACITNVTRQAVYIAIKKEMLKASKEGRWQISLDDLDEYRKNRWNRVKSIRDGKPLVSAEKGEYLVRQIAEKLGIPEQKIYYAIRCNTLKSKRRGSSYIITIEDALEYKEKYLKPKVAA